MHICVQCTAVSAVGKPLNLFSANNYCSDDWLLNKSTLLENVNSDNDVMGSAQGYLIIGLPAQALL